VVVASSFIIARVIVERLFGYRSDAQLRTCQLNQVTVHDAIQAYDAMFEDSVYPTGFDDMLRPETRALRSIPTCPLSDKPYIWVEGSPPSISCPTIADILYGSRLGVRASCIRRD